MLVFSGVQAPGWTALLTLSIAVSVPIKLLTPAIMAAAVDSTLAGSPAASAAMLLGAFLAISMLADVLYVWAGSESGVAVGVALRRGMARHVLRVGVAGIRRYPAGDVSSRMVSGVFEASRLLPVALSLAEMVVLSAGGLVALALIDWSLALAFAACVPVAALLIRRFVVDSSDLMERYQALQGSLSARLVEAMSGVRTIRACGTVEREIQRVTAPLPELAKVGRETWEVHRRTAWKMSLLGPVAQITVLAVAGLAVSDGRISVGSWIAVVRYVGIALGLLNVIDGLTSLAQIRAGTARLTEVLAMPAGPGGSRDLPAGPGEIEFRSVAVELDGKVMLDGVDLAIPAGSVVAVVGRSGAGKSLLAALAGGLLAPDRGEVLLDGVAVTELRPEQLRHAVGYAFDKPALFGDTVHDMIAGGVHGMPREQTEIAALRVSADRFIRKLPMGYDTPLQQTPLSGGEAQRLGLARAMAREHRVLILDDAMSSLDTVSEADVTTALSRLSSGTRIVVTHRAATAARADQVVWLEEGRVSAMGRHDELRRQPGYLAVFGAGEATLDKPA